MAVAREHEAREQLVGRVLRRLSAEHLPADDPHRADELTYCDELVAHAARNLTRAVDQLPVDEQPVGWSL